MRAFFSPAGCAVVGASRDPAKPGHQMLRSMLDAGFPAGRLFPVNPGETEIAGLPAYPDLSSIPGRVELAVLMVPPRALDTVLADVAGRASRRRDLAALIVTAGGYAELGTAEGRDRQAKLAEAARAAGVRLMGPNCIGVIDTRSHVDTTFLHGVVRRPGAIGFVSQSGALGAWFLQMLSAEPEPVGFSKFVSLGNMADLDMAETLDYLRADPATGVIGLYLEGTADPRPLLAAIARASAEKPVVVLKTGRSATGGAAATSHTGALAGPDRVWDGALRQAGALRADGMEEFVDTLRILAGGHRPPVRAPLRVFLVTHAGGPGVYTMDLLAARPRHVTMARVSPETKAALRAAVPPMSSVCRPEGHLDMTASATPEQHAEVVKLLLRDPGVDALVTLDLPIRFLGEEVVAAALAGAWREVAGERAADGGAAAGGAAGQEAGLAGGGKIFLPLLMHGKWSEAGRRVLESAGLTALGGPDRVVDVLADLARLAELKVQAGREDLLAPKPGKGGPAGRVHAGPAPAGGGTTLSEVESAALLARHGVTFAPSRLACSREEALAAARHLGLPVVLKLCSRRIPHKVAAGGVRLGLRALEDVGRAYDELLTRAREVLSGTEEPGGGREERPEGLDGVLVQSMAAPGFEVIVGGLRDPLFGPVVAAGAGGTRVGLDAPLSFRLAPLSEGGARRLAEEVLGQAGGGAAGPDPATLTRAILAMSRLLVERPDVVEADLNPVILYPRGRGGVAVDALVRVVSAG